MKLVPQVFGLQGAVDVSQLVAVATGPHLGVLPRLFLHHPDAPSTTLTFAAAALGSTVATAVAWGRG